MTEPPPPPPAVLLPKGRLPVAPLALSDTRAVSNLNRAPTVEGWFGTGLRAIMPWKQTFYEEYWRDKLDDADAAIPYDEVSQKRYRLFLVKTVSTPGTVAGTELYLRSSIARYKPYLAQFAAEWDNTPDAEVPVRTTPFEDAMFQMAVAASKFSFAMIERWQKWCTKNNRAKSRESFKEFAHLMPIDSNVSHMMLERMHFFSMAFCNIYKPLVPNMSEFGTSNVVSGEDAFGDEFNHALGELFDSVLCSPDDQHPTLGYDIGQNKHNKT